MSSHLKANEQNWAGTVIDESFIIEILKRGHNLDKFLFPYAKKYKVPYKTNLERGRICIKHN